MRRHALTSSAVLSMFMLGGWGVACGGDDGPSASATPAAEAGSDAASTCKAPTFRPPGSDDCIVPGWSECGDGFAPEPKGAGCIEVAAETCAAGTMPKLGDTKCAPVGVAACTGDFVRDDSGFGCAPKQAPKCTGATRETAAGCVPVGDCSAAFPPPAATIFVDDSYTAGQLDATHFQTIAAAVQAATTGATIAIEAGTYAAVTISKDVTLVGRCAAQVTVQGASGAGITVASAVDVSLRDFRVTGFAPGIDASGGTISLDAMVIEGNDTAGLRVKGTGTRASVKRSMLRGATPGTASVVHFGATVEGGAALALEDVAVVDHREAAIAAEGAGSSLKLTRTWVARTTPLSAGLLGAGVRAANGARVDIDESVIADSVGNGVSFENAAGAVKNSIVTGVTSGARADGATPRGDGVFTGTAPDVTIEKTTIADTSRSAIHFESTTATVREVAFIDAGVDVLGGKTALGRVAVVGASGFGVASRDANAMKLEDVLVTKTRAKSAVGYAVIATARGSMEGRGVVVTDTTGTGVIAFDRARISLERSIVDRVAPAGGQLGVGVLSEKASEVTLKSSVVRRATSFGVVAKGAKLDLSDVAVRETQGTDDDDAGFALAASEGASVSLARVALLDNAVVALIAEGKDTKVTASATTIARTRSAGASGGVGVQAQGAARIELTRAHITDSVGVAALAFGSSLRFDESLVERTLAGDPPFGHAVAAVTSRMDLRRTMVRSNPGVGIVYEDGTGIVTGSLVEKNAVAINVGGSSELVSTGVEPTEPDDKKVLVSSDTAFVDNETRIGSGAVALPPKAQLPK